MAVITDLEKGEIDKALQNAGGKREEAARALGMSWQQLRDAIKNCPDLKARWSKTRRNFAAPTTDDISSRPPIRYDTHLVPLEPIPKESEVEARMALADAKLHDGLLRSPLTLEEQSLTEELHKLQTRHGTAISETIHGCIALQALKLTNLLAKLHRELEESGEMLQTEAVTARKKYVLEMIPVLTAELRKLVEADGNHAIAKATLEFKRAQNSAPKSRQKPGFSPLVAVSVASGSKVELNDSKTKTPV